MALIKCPNCGKEVSDKAKFCTVCEFAINAKKYQCKECGGRSLQKFKVCPNCGYETNFIKRHVKTTILCGVAAGIILISAVIKNVQFKEYYMPSTSMEDTIKLGDTIKCNTWYYIFRDIERFDIVVFKQPDSDGTLSVKRVIGMPGETVTMKKGRAYINDSKVPLEEPYLKEEPISMGDGVYEIPEGCYFVLGDNRNNSKDSRAWGINTLKKI